MQPLQHLRGNCSEIWFLIRISANAGDRSLTAIGTVASREQPRQKQSGAKGRGVCGEGKFVWASFHTMIQWSQELRVQCPSLYYLEHVNWRYEWSLCPALLYRYFLTTMPAKEIGSRLLKWQSRTIRQQLVKSKNQSRRHTDSQLQINEWCRTKPRRLRVMA